MKKTFTTHGRLLSHVFSSYNTTFDALCELINNSIQANATEIKIEIDLDEDISPYPFTEYRIIDNGEGVSKSDFDHKILQIATDAKGSKGIGRFASFQIGSTVMIDTTAYDKQLKKYTNTTITFDVKSLTEKEISTYNIDVVSSELEQVSTNTFYKIAIRNFWDEAEKKKNPKKKIIAKLLPDQLEEALFLKYSPLIVVDKVNFIINEKKLSKELFLVGNIEKDNFDFIFENNTTEKIYLEYVNYRSKSRKIILAYRVENNGLKISGFDEYMTFDYPDENSWLVHVDCDYFNDNADIFRNLPLDGLDEDMAKLKKSIKNAVRNFIKNKHTNYYSFLEKLVCDKYYPYKGGSPSSSKEYTFNRLAYYIEEDYSLLKTDQDTRKIIYPLLDRAMNNGDIIGILENVLSLDDEQLKNFKAILDNTDLSNIIKFTSELIKKEQFLDFLHQIIYGDIRSFIKERKQLHKIIEKNLWIFGEEYSNTPTVFSDKNLKNSLDKLREKYLKYEPTKGDDNLADIEHKEIADITDLFLYNEKPLPNSRQEVLIVELKAPKVKISQKELNQVNRYKYDIEMLGEFSKLNTQYKIILISSDVTPLAKSQIGVIDRRYPTLFQRSKIESDYDIEIHVINWSEIITNRRQHLKYLGNHLEIKDTDLKNIFQKDYPELDISNLPMPGKK